MRVAAFLAVILFSPLAAADEEPFITKRCEAVLGMHGAAPVKTCVDQDVAALGALKSYAPATKRAVDRCESLLRPHGWRLVKECADRDIKAAAELAAYTQRDVVRGCERRMARFGAAMVQSCADHELKQ
jgi:hypothetical protein